MSSTERSGGDGSDGRVQLSPRDVHAATLSDVANELDLRSVRLSKAAESLFDAWIGRSAESYKLLYESWSESNAAMVNELEKMVRGLGAAAAEYAESGRRQRRRHQSDDRQEVETASWRHSICFDELAKIISEMKAYRAELERAQAEVARMAACFEAGSSTGAGAREFAEAQVKWTSNASRIADDLDDLRIAAEVTVKNYRSAREANLEMLGRSRPGEERKREASKKMEIDVHARDRAGRIELHYAAIDNGEDCEPVRRLLAQGADIDARDFKGMTPLLMAAQYPGTRMVIELLIASGASVAALDNMDRSALMLVLMRAKSVEVERLFLEAGCDPHHRDKSGYTPASLVDECGTEEQRVLFSDF